MKRKCIYTHRSVSGEYLKLDFLGMHVTFNKVTISEEKIAALKIYPVPVDFPAVRRFMGFVGHMQQFIPHFSTIAAPLTNMLRNQEEKKKKFIWTSTEQNAFEKLIKDLCDATGLMMPDLRGQFVMETDASALGVGATLYQFVDDKLLPLWFLSKKFSLAEANYSPRDREALAIVHREKTQYHNGYLFHIAVTYFTSRLPINCVR